MGEVRLEEKSRDRDPSFEEWRRVDSVIQWKAKLGSRARYGEKEDWFANKD